VRATVQGVNNQNVSPQVARRVHIAASVAAGRSLSATARELGISREWASKIANAPETQQIIATLVHSQAVGRLVQILTAGRPLPKPEERKEERRTITLEELEAVIEQSRIRTR
jgi:hypothetical protein